MNARDRRLTTAWLAGQASERTRLAYGRDVAAYLAWCRAAGISPLQSRSEDLDTYRDACLRDGASAATVARRLSAIASFFRHATAVGAMDGNPADAVDRPIPSTAPRAALDARELAQLVAAAEQLGSKTAALVALLGLDGIKLNQVLGINIPRVHLGGRSGPDRDRASWVDVDRRGGREQVQITAQSADLVRAHIASRRRGPLFVGDTPTGEGARLTRFGADFLIKRAGAAADLGKPVSANVLRRTYIEAAHRAGTSIEHIARHVGHRDARETARYLGE